MGEDKELEVKSHYHWAYNTVFGALLLILFVLFVLWQTNKDAYFYIVPPFLLPVAVVFIGHVAFIMFFTILLYGNRTLANTLTRLFHAIAVSGGLLGCSMCCWLGANSFDFIFESQLVHYDSLNFHGQRYHLDGQLNADDVFEFGSSDAQNTVTVWECDQFGIVCRQIESSQFGRGHPSIARLEVDPETDQLIMVVEDQRYVVEGVD